MCLHVCCHGGQKRVFNPLELELQLLPTMRLLGIKPKSSGKGATTLNHSSSFPNLILNLFLLSYLELNDLPKVTLTLNLRHSSSFLFVVLGILFVCGRHISHH